MEGKVLNERYKIIKQLGQGGMALVFEARDILLDRKVALKMLRPEHVSDKDFIKKFRQEARAVARISHPNVVSIFDIARDKNYHYLVMEYIEGQNLKDIIRERGKLTLTEGLDIARQICTALNVAHENNIIHCDIKPHNIIIDREKQVKVTDFGIARAVTSSTITATDTIMGSAHYFSPEQAKGGEIRAYSDLYSVGVVLYEMLTGRVPFPGDSPISVALKHIQEKPEKPSLLNSEIPSEVDEIIMKALAKEPEERFSDAGSMRKAIIRSLKNLKNNRKQEKKVVVSRSDDTKVIKKTDLQSGDKVKAEVNGGDQDTKKTAVPEPEEKINERGPGWLVWVAIIMVIITVGAGILFLIYQNYTDVPIVKVPDVVGMEVDEAQAVASQVGLKLEKQQEEVFHPDIEKGKIISQYPRAGDRVKQTRRIQVTVSNGPQLITVPELVNKSLREAKVILDNENIPLGDIRYVYSDEISSNQVIKQDPKPGEEVEGGISVDLNVSRGMMPNMVEVPNLIGLNKQEALRKLTQNNLREGEIQEKRTTRFLEDQVAEQNYEPGEQVPENTAVDLTISRGIVNEGSMKVHTSTVGIDVMGFEEQEIKIIVMDANGTDTVYKNIHEPGDHVKQTINSVGPTTFQVYIDGRMVKEQKIGDKMQS